MQSSAFFFFYFKKNNKPRCTGCREKLGNVNSPGSKKTNRKSPQGELQRGPSIILECREGLWEAGESPAPGCLASPIPAGLSQDRGTWSHRLSPWHRAMFTACGASDELKYPQPFPKQYPKAWSSQIPAPASVPGEDEPRVSPSSRRAGMAVASISPWVLVRVFYVPTMWFSYPAQT